MLTTHSMEEAEALTQRIAIMVGGSLRCLGTTQRLKALYGQGYQLDATIAPEQREAFQQEICSHFANTKLVEAHDSYLKYEIPRGSADGQRVSIGSVFRLMEAIKEKFGVREYALSETSLESVMNSVVVRGNRTQASTQHTERPRGQKPHDHMTSAHVPQECSSNGCQIITESNR